MEKKLVYKKEYRKAITDNVNNVKSKYDLKKLYLLTIILKKPITQDILKDNINLDREVRYFLTELIECKDAEFLRKLRFILQEHNNKFLKK